MIGVVADPADHDIAREFFELFKTPWEFYSTGRQYEVLLCLGGEAADTYGKLTIFYAGRTIQFDERFGIEPDRPSLGGILSYQQHRLPIYCDLIIFAKEEHALLTEESSNRCAAFLKQTSHGAVARIGYDLFAEIRSLLTAGQPAANALLPALELHISVLRDVITCCGISVPEIPPVPEGHDFIVCLTHDVDHPSVRQHKWDHTSFGFLFRAVVGSLERFVRRRLPARDVLRNWAAALKLPLVHLRLVNDFWYEFADRYLQLENGRPSTFFVIPFKDQPGTSHSGSPSKLRAVRYGARDIADNIQKLSNAGCEIGLHGIDAWHDSCRGRSELDEIRNLTGAPETGVRMHWLYYGQHSAANLEKAGAAYDSTIGFNNAVGYRAGTTQVYRPLGASQLLELPLHVMDTALFYRAYLDLSSAEAETRLRKMEDNVGYFGGILTVNWHDRSLAPERLWGGAYRNLIDRLERRGAWFATAGQAVAWFRKRRAATFEIESPTGKVRARVAVDHAENLPALRLRVHEPRGSGPGGAASAAPGIHADFAVEETDRATVTA